jgi:radical SAM superfamily enzyme YgiQ (UPF0313 family)
MRILFIQPDFRSAIGGFRLAAMPEPLSLEMIAATVTEHELRLLDMRLDSDLDGVLQTFQPDLVGITALTTEVYAALEVLATVKRHNASIFTVVGGHHATLMPADFFVPTVDAIVLGEGENVFGELVRSVETTGGAAMVPGVIRQDADGRFVTNPGEPLAVDIESLPLPRRDLVAAYRDKYYFLFDQGDYSVATSRGCPYRCNFCSVWSFYGGKTRQMTPRRVLAELQSIDAPHVTFVDDNFLMNHRRENTIADMIAAEGIRMRYSMECRTDSIVRHPELVEKWARRGLYAVLLGLEGADDGALASVNKKNTSRVNDEAIRILQDLGVIIWGAFIVDPKWEADDFKRLRDYVNARQITHTQFTILTPLPGTDLYREHYHTLLTHDYRSFDALHAVVPTKLPREEFYQHFADLYRQTSFGPYIKLLREGKLTIDDCKRGKQLLDGMSDWQCYLPQDPVLGGLAVGTTV